MFSICCETPLPVSCAETYKGIAFDGCQYYLTVNCECKIAVLDCDFSLLRKVETRRPYTAICFDPCSACFWAASDQHWATLFKLDCCLHEIDRLTLCFEGCRRGPITSVSYCCGDDFLLVSCGSRLLAVHPTGGESCMLREERKDGLIFAAASLSPFIIYYVMRGCAVYWVLADCRGTPLSERREPGDLYISALLLDPCRGRSGIYDLLMLTNKHCRYPYLLRAPLGRELSRALCPCNETLCRACDDPCGHVNKSCCECEKPCRPPKKDACGDIMESIALQEAALAHILNAEGEKLQKVVAGPADTCELLQVNESVQRTIVHVTHLEQMLFSKLDVLRSLCSCKPEPPPCPRPCGDCRGQCCCHPAEEHDCRPL